ncbi:MAG TPA: hypothetical protein VJI32_03650 [Candidatus Nanoarchaeia archaeon]|nr:hypothetical protein [Candidatus Nanoarchaeia archaeon]
MNIDKLVAGLVLGYALAMPAYASSPRDPPAPEFPSFTGEEERALGLETLAGLIITRMPHPQVAYTKRP